MSMQCYTCGYHCLHGVKIWGKYGNNDTGHAKENSMSLIISVNLADGKERLNGNVSPNLWTKLN